MRYLAALVIFLSLASCSIERLISKSGINHFERNTVYKKSCVEYASVAGLKKMAQ